MIKSDDCNEAKVEQPNIMAKPQNLKQTRKSRLGCLLLIIPCILLFLIIVAAAVLKWQYNDEYIKNHVISSLSNDPNINVTISDLTTNWLTQTVEIRDLSLGTNSDSDNKLIFIKSISAKLNIAKTIAEESFNADIIVDSIVVNVKRMQTRDERTGEERYTTNITEALNNLIDLPWKKWLNDINWRTAGGTLHITNSSINLRDDLHILKDCYLSNLNIDFGRIKEELKLQLSLIGKTPIEATGKVDIDVNAKLTKIANINVNSKISFLKDITISGKIDDFDVPYFLSYFGTNKTSFGKTSIEFVDPVSLDLNVKSNTMKNVFVNTEISSPSIGKISFRNKAIKHTPPIKVNVECKLNLFNTWSEIEPLTIKVDLGNDLKKMITITSQINGNFGDEFTVTLNAITDFTIFSNSKFGKELGSKIYGKINHNFAGNWKRNNVWKAKYQLSGKNITTTINGAQVSLPLHGEIDCIISKSKLLTPLKGSFNFDFSSPSFKIKSIKPLQLDFTKSSEILQTSIEYYADMAKVYDTFENLFKAFDLGKINEIMTGTLDADTNGNTKWAFTTQSTLKKYKGNIVRVTGELTPKAAKAYDFKTSITGLGNNVTFNIGGDVTRSDDVWQAHLTQSGTYDLIIVEKMYSRFNDIFNGNEILFNSTGSLRAAINANVTFTDTNNLTVATSLRANIKDFTTTIRNHSFARSNLDINSSLVLKKHMGDLSVSINNFKLVTPDSNVELKAGNYNLSQIKNVPWRTALKALPELVANLDVSLNDMETIGKIIKNRIAILYFQQATVKAKITTKGGVLATVDDFDYHSKIINVKAHKRFNINPIIMTDKIIEKKWFEIQKSLSDVDLTVSSDMYQWRTFVPKVAIDVTGGFAFSAKYYQKKDELFVTKFSTKAATREDVLIPSISFNGRVVNFFKNISKFDFKEFALSINNNLNISQAKISISKIKLLAGDRPGSNIRALRGDNITLTDVIAQHTLGSPIVKLAGKVNSISSFLSRSSKWPILEIAGTISNYKTPLLLKLDKDIISTKGAIDLTESSIQFNALAPYRYKKEKTIPLKLDFIAAVNNNQEAKVKTANLVGGPLAVTLKGFSFKPIQERFKLSIDSIKLDGPFTAEVDNLLLDSATDHIKGNILVAPIDLSVLQQSINYSLPIKIYGTLGKTEIKIDDNYWRYFAPVGKKVKRSRAPNNYTEIGTTKVSIASNDDSVDESITLAFSHGNADVSNESIVLSNVTIDNPTGYSDTKAVDAELVTIKPDLQTLFSDQIIIDRIDIDELKAFYEVSLRKSNIDVLRENVTKIFSGEKNTEVNSRKTLIKDIYVNNGVVRVSSTLFKGSRGLPVPLNLHLENIGGENPGETFASGFGKIFSGIGKVGLGLVGGVGGIIGEVGQVGKSIITAPFKLFKKSEDDTEEQGQ